MGYAAVGVHSRRTGLYRWQPDHYAELHRTAWYTHYRQPCLDCPMRDIDADKSCERLCYSQIHTCSWGGVIIEDDCWIGAGAIILNGITIGKGSVVGAGSVVTKDVPPYTIVAGNPARKIKDIPIES